MLFWKSLFMSSFSVMIILNSVILQFVFLNTVRAPVVMGGNPASYGSHYK